MNSNSIDIYVELLDEGVETWREAKAIPLENDLYRLLEPSEYNPEDELWDFLPGSVVRLKQATFYTGLKGLLATHPDPKALRVFVESSEPFAPTRRETYALALGNELYKILPTPHYTSKQLWKFPPDSIVRLKKIKCGIPAFPGDYYFLAIDANS